MQFSHPKLHRESSFSTPLMQGHAAPSSFPTHCVPCLCACVPGMSVKNTSPPREPPPRPGPRSAAMTGRCCCRMLLPFAPYHRACRGIASGKFIRTTSAHIHTVRLGGSSARERHGTRRHRSAKFAPFATPRENSAQKEKCLSMSEKKETTFVKRACEHREGKTLQKANGSCDCAPLCQVGKTVLN